MCVLIMDRNIVNGEKNLGETLKRYPFSIIFAILAVPSFIFVGAMLFFHTYLIFKNITTK